MDFYKLKPGDNYMSILPPEGEERDYPYFRLKPMTYKKYKAYVNCKEVNCFLFQLEGNIMFRNNEKDPQNVFKEAAD